MTPRAKPQGNGTRAGHEHVTGVTSTGNSGEADQP